MEALHQARFADPRLADDQRHLAFAIEGALPAIHQQAQFVLAPDEWGQSTRRRGRFEPPAHSARPDYAIKLDRPFDALERLRSAILDHEQPRDQPMRGVGDHHRAGFGGRLHPRGNIGRVAEDVGCPCPRLRQPPPCPNRSRPARRVWVRGCSLSFADRVEDREARARRPLGVVVVRLGPAEVGHHAVAKVLRDMPVEALDRLRRRTMVPADDLAPLLGIEMAAISVEPTRSQKSTVRWRRSPSGTSCGSPCSTTTGAAAGSAEPGAVVRWERLAPQSPQNFLPQRDSQRRISHSGCRAATRSHRRTVCCLDSQSRTWSSASNHPNPGNWPILYHSAGDRGSAPHEARATADDGPGVCLARS